MNKNDVEFLFEEDVQEENQDEEFIKDPSLDNVFPDKDIDIDRLLNKFEEETKDFAEKEEKEKKNEIKEKKEPKMKL